MKKIYLTLFTILSIFQFTYAQWNNVSGTGNYYLNSGNVGIGTTTPRSLLEVSNGTLGNTLMILSNSGTYGSLLRIGTIISNFRQESQIQYQNILGIWDPNGSTNVPRMYFDPNGNVGIGTSSPSAKLNVVNVLSGVHSTNQSLFRTDDMYNAGTNGQFFQIIGAGDGTSVTNISLISNWGYLSLGARADAGAIPTNSLNIFSSGNVGIGTINPDQKLTVKGTIHSQAVIVDNNITPDYVFKPDYKLVSLKNVKAYIDKNHHLPEIPSAKTIAKQGLNLGEMNTLLLKKVEELTLYTIASDNNIKEEKTVVAEEQALLSQQQSQLKIQQEEIDQLKQQVQLLIKALNKN